MSFDQKSVFGVALVATNKVVSLQWMFFFLCFIGDGQVLMCLFKLDFFSSFAVLTAELSFFFLFTYVFLYQCDSFFCIFPATSFKSFIYL